jgi:hypothetical protein
MAYMAKKTWDWKPKKTPWEWTPQEFTRQPRGGSRGLRKARGATSRNAEYEQWGGPADKPADRTIENARAKASAAIRALAKVADNADEIRDSNAHAEILDQAQNAGRQAANAAKPWALRKKHTQTKIDHKERTVESAKVRLKSSEEELDALTIRVGKERGEVQDRKNELGKARDEMVVILSTKGDHDSSEDDDDESDDDDEDEDACSTRELVVCLERQLEQQRVEHARVVAKLSDDVNELRAARGLPVAAATSVVTVSIASGDEEDDEGGEMQVDKKARFAMGASGKKQAKHRRSRSRARRNGDYDPNTIWDGSGNKKVHIQ